MPREDRLATSTKRNIAGHLHINPKTHLSIALFSTATIQTVATLLSCRSFDTGKPGNAADAVTFALVDAC